MKNYLIRPLLVRVAAVLLALAAPALSGCKKDDPAKQLEDSIAATKVVDDGLIQEYLTRKGITEGTGIGQYQRLNDEANKGIYLVSLANGPGTTNIVSGNRADVRYIGRFLKASNETTVFDNSTEKGTPCGCISVLLGASQVKPGFEQGLLFMKKGDRKLLLVPSYLMYGATGINGTIPPNEPLLFDMTILDVR